MPIELALPPVRVDEVDGVRIVRDDLLLGGTKARVVPDLMRDGTEWVYAGPAQGYAQVALAIGSAISGVPATFFCAKRREPLPLTRAAQVLGLRVIEVPAGRSNVLESRARAYCRQVGATLVPMGLRFSGMGAAVERLAATIPAPTEAWVAVGSGTLAAALARAWPDTKVHGVMVGMRPAVVSDRIEYHRAPEAFADPLSGPAPPVPSLSSYDAKVWRFVSTLAGPGALWWNVAGPAPTAALVRTAIERGTLDLASLT